MSHLEPQYSSIYDFDTDSDLLAEGIIDADDLAAIAGLQMQQEELSRLEDEELEKWLEIKMPEEKQPNIVPNSLPNILDEEVF
ncbi:hypothetical protein [Brunnivagina elsteri]|uniref:Uncharacterized protein n=1 Tax=Brunnivagina elsteri CCALA 953 TaxID=987040 RepID=A0A2A2TEZ1_9CYAN|nr:hypothetical protein [Calothrix elsteri]PAX52198.1 hypothetical protein CK510_20615 [Calothrix elsteri CCALA 953]